MNALDRSHASVLAVIVHFGAVGPSIRVANSATLWADSIVVIANDLGTRPDGLDDRVLWLIPEVNLGYGGAANWAWHKFGPGHDVMVLMNNDIVLSAEGAELCINQTVQGSIAVLAPVLLEGTLGMERSIGRLTSIAKRPVRDTCTGTAELIDCEWVSGAIMFISNRALQHATFETRYFLGFEDVDFCLRSRKLGLRVVVMPSVSVPHVGGQVIGGLWYYYATRNGIWFAWSNFGWPYGLLMVARNSVLFWRVAIADFLKRRGLRASKRMLIGMNDGLWFKTKWME